MYKVIRMDNLTMTEEENSKEHNLKEVNIMLEKAVDNRKRITILMLCKKNLKSKCREYLNGKITKEYENGDFEYEIEVPENEQFWYGVILSFGKKGKVIAPTGRQKACYKDF